MSHVPQRKEKDCLNCGTIVAGRYCQNCGQENVVPKETFWHMFTHFFYDLTHFDSSFFHTVHHLIFKPGFLSTEYMLGRRMRYLHPVRMYVFTSAMFFLLFFSLFKPDKIKVTTNANDPLPKKERIQTLKSVESRLKKDSTNAELIEAFHRLKDSTEVITNGDKESWKDPESEGTRINGRMYRSKAEYDSVQASLPKEKRAGWLQKRFNERQIEVFEKFSRNKDEFLRELAESLLHRLPYMLFLSLPLFALLLKLVYVRRKQFYYADHGVFTIHLYVFTFLLLMVVFGVSRLGDLLNRDVGFLIAVLFILLYFYFYKAMRNFYGQRRAKTIVKFLMVSFLSLMMMIILFAGFAFFSAFTL